VRTDLSGKVIGTVLLIVAIIAGFWGDAFGALFLGFFSGANFFATSRSQHEGASS
jgi:hypothetical protein